MSFFRHSKTHGSYDLFSSYSYYAPGTGGMFMLLLMLLVGTLLGNIVILILQSTMSGNFANDYGMLISYPLMFIPAMIYASAKSRSNELFEENKPLDSNNFSSVYKGVATAIAVSAATIAAALLCDPISLVLPEMPAWLKETFDRMISGMPLWATLLSVSVFAPFFEEWLCRGMILRGLLGKMKPAWAIVISALFFAFIHMNPWQALPAFLLGLLFGYVYYKTGSLKLTMLMHCVNNTFSVLIGQMDALKDADTFFDVLTHAEYAGLLAASASVLFSILFWFTKGVTQK